MSEEGNEEVADQSTKKDGEEDNSLQNIVEIVAVVFSFLLLVVLFPVFLPQSIRIIHQYERGLVVRLGRAGKKEVLQPGVVFILPLIDVLWVQDVRTKCCTTAAQQVLTKDSVSIKIAAVLTVDVKDAYQCLLVGQGSTNFVSSAAKRRVQNTLRSACGKLTLTEVISGKESLTRQVLRTITRKWPSTLKVTRVEIQDISIPQEMQRSMASEAISQRQAKAKVIFADGEIRASHVLKQAADIVDQSPAAVHLRYFQSLMTVSRKKCKTIVLPFPPQVVDILKRR